MKRKLGVTCVCVSIFAAILFSQSPATLFGTVTDQSGAVIPGSQVVAKLLPSGPTISAVTDSQGRYSLFLQAVGEYEVRYTMPGFQMSVQRIKMDHSGMRLERNVVLPVGSVSEAVTVEASPSQVQTSSSSVSGRPRGSIRELPLNGRAMSQIIIQSGASADHERIPAHGVRKRSAPWNTAQYDDFVENEFAQVKTAPLSTFSVDVDTASYSNVRRFLNEGHLPPAGAVRIEELVNYFTYDYPLPDSGKPVSVTTHFTNCPWNPNHQLILLGLRTRPIAWENAPPTRLTFLVDVSGSMMPAKRLPLAKQGLRMLVRQLRPEDSVSLVVYAGAAGAVLPPTPGTRKQEILDAIDRLESGGSTHGSAGIRLAYEMARESFLPNGNNRVILATDGDFNVGVSSDSELVSLIERERESGIFLSVLGFGTDNLKDSRMKKLADHGNGNYAYIDTLQEARKVLVQQMGATLLAVAKDVKLQIEFNPANVKAYRLIGYESRILRPEEFNDDKKDAGDLGAGHQVTALYEIIPAGSLEEIAGVDRLRYQKEPKPAAARSAELGWVKLRHKSPESSKSELLEWPIRANAVAFSSLPADARFAASVAEYGLLLRGSKFAAHSTFDQVLSIAGDAVASGGSEEKLEFLTLARRAKELSQYRLTSER